jgi:hypothetical protein
VSSVVATLLEALFLGRQRPNTPEPPRNIKQIN